MSSFFHLTHEAGMTRVVNASLDVLKLGLAVLVIALHSKVMGGIDSELGHLLCNGLFRVAVPVFFVINGYFLAQALASGQPFGKWWRRILWLYLFWMLVYSPFFVPGAGLFATFKYLAIGFFHLWYLVGMLGASVMLCILGRAPTVWLGGLAAVLYLAGLALQYARVYLVLPEPFLQHLIQNDYVARNFLFMAFPYMTVGWLFFRHQVASRVSREGVLGALFIGVLALALESWCNFQAQGVQHRNFDFLLSLPLLAPVIFLLPFVFGLPTTRSAPGKVASAMFFSHPLAIQVALMLGLAYGNLMFVLVMALTLAMAPLWMMLGRRWRFIL